MLRGESGRILRELFELGDLTAGEVARAARMAGRDSRWARGRRTARDRQGRLHTRYPVYSGDLDNIVGSVHIKELLRHLISGTAGHLPWMPVRCRTVPATMPIDELLSAMRRQSSQMAVVMDEQGGTAGLVTIEDLFEEVVGEIEEGRSRNPIMRDSVGTGDRARNSQAGGR
jgi:CBS domain containing-hemolysin-like protein